MASTAAQQLRLAAEMPIAVYALALAAFAVGTAEFIVSGLLPPLAADLGITIPTAGLLVTGYGAAVAVVSPILGALTAGIPRRTMLIGVLLTFVLGNVLCAIAPSYGLLLAGRIVVACAHGLFFGVSLIIIGALVPQEKSGGAFGLFFAGLTVATVIGVPGGTAIGTAFGWRVAFWFVGALSALASVAAVFLIPRAGTDGGGQTALGPQIRQLRKQELYLSYAMISFAMLGIFGFLTYQVPMLREVTGIPPEQVPIYLFVAGSATIAGSLIGGWIANWRLMPATVAITVLFVPVLLLISLSARVPLAVGGLMAALGLLLGAFATPIQARIVAAGKEAPALATTLISTAFNIGIAGGAAIGSVLLSSGAEYTVIPALGALTCLIAAGIGVLSWRLEAKAGR